MAAGSRERLVEAALEALKTKGFGGASARTIAALAGVNPGLIFYYFDTLDELLLAALARSSEDRLDRYRGALEEIVSAPELVGLLRRIYREDLDSGHIRVVSEMVSGSVSRPGMGERVMELMQPWIATAEEAARRVLAGSPVAALVSPRDLAFAAVTFYLGANLIVHLGSDAAAIDRLLETAEQASGLLELLGGQAREGPV
jgi:AcrR family transcriptional regulator